MNAPTTIPPPAVAEYAPIVQRHLPGVKGKELEMRCRLMKARDMAATRLKGCTGEAYGVWEHIRDTAGHYAEHAETVEKLTALRALLVRLTVIATDLDTFATPKPRETDARG